MPAHTLVPAALALAGLAAAVALASVTVAAHACDVVRTRRRARRAARWTPVLLDVIEGVRPPEAFHVGLRPAERADALHLLATYAVRLRGEGRHRLCAAAEPLLPVALRDLSAASPGVRARGVHTLGLLGGPSVVGAVVAALDDPSQTVALSAARALARRGDPDTIASVVARVGRFDTVHPTVVASLLARFGLRAGPVLMEVLPDRRASVASRVAVVEALRRLSYVPSASLGARCLSEPGLDADLAAALLRLLLDVGETRHAAIVRQHARSDDEVVRLHALSALARLGGSQDDVLDLAFAIEDPNPWVALRAERGLREVGVDEAHPPVPAA